MKYICILFVIILTSCVTYIEGNSIYDCGVVVGGGNYDGEYWLLVSYPDGEYRETVTQKAYEHYNLFDEICFYEIDWE